MSLMLLSLRVPNLWLHWLVRVETHQVVTEINQVICWGYCSSAVRSRLSWAIVSKVKEIRLLLQGLSLRLLLLNPLRLNWSFLHLLFSYGRVLDLSLDSLIEEVFFNLRQNVDLFLLFNHTSSNVFWCDCYIWKSMLNCSPDDLLFQLLLLLFNMLMRKDFEVCQHRSVVRESIVLGFIRERHNVFIFLKPKDSISVWRDSLFLRGVILVTSLVILESRFELYVHFLVLFAEVNLMPHTVQLVMLEQSIERLSTPATCWQLYSFFIRQVYSKVHVSKEELDLVIFVLIDSSFFLVEECIVNDLSPLLKSFMCLWLSTFKMGVAEDNWCVVEIKSKSDSSLVSYVSSKPSSNLRWSEVSYARLDRVSAVRHYENADHGVVMDLRVLIARVRV